MKGSLINLMAIALLFSLANAHATVNDYCFNRPTPIKGGAWYADLGLGWAFNYKQRDISVAQGNTFPDRYFPSENKESVFFTVSAGYSWLRDNAWFPIFSLGLEYSNFPSFDETGKIQKFSQPNLLSYAYSYKVASQQLNLIGKINIYRWQGLSPYMLAGIGTAWNKVSDYSEMALPGITPRRSPGFQNATSSNSVYMLGFGLDYNLTRNLQLGLGYRYDDFGKVHSGTGVTAGFSNVILQSNKSSLSAILANVRYYFA